MGMPRNTFAKDQSKVPQVAGCLPEGYNLDSLLTVEQFAVWRQISEKTARKYLPILPGVGGHTKRNKFIHPRTFLENETGFLTKQVNNKSFPAMRADDGRLRQNRIA
jgi:hypothetical protein